MYFVQLQEYCICIFKLLSTMASSHELPDNLTACVRVRLCKLQKWCSRLAAANEKAYKLLAQGRWFSSGTPVSSTTKTGRRDIAEILLKVALKHNKSINQSRQVVHC